MSDINSFIAGIPPITKFVVITPIVILGLDKLGVVSITFSMLLWPEIIHGWQVWRPFTSLFVVSSQLPGAFEIYALYSYSRGLEENKFFRDIPDYLFYYALVLPFIITSGFLLEAVSLARALEGALTYTWSRANRTRDVNLYFLPIKASHLPVMTLGFALFFDGPLTFLIVLSGMSAAYMYACIESKSLGPLYSYLKETLGINVIRHQNTNRVGTIHTINEVHDGYLRAPTWFRSIIEFFTGRQVSPGFRTTTGSAKSARVNTLNGPTSIDKNSGSTTAKSSGFSFGGSGTFKGKGNRLGST